MSKKSNSNVPSAVGTNRTYGQVILENLRNGWEAIKSNTYVNMFVPLADAAEGNTLAVVTSAVPGKQAVTTAGKAILGNADEVVKPARKIIKPGAKKAGDFIEDGIEYTAYGSSQPGTTLYFSVPKSEVTRGKPQWIPTLEEVAEAIAKHTSSAKKAVSESVRRATDWAATQKASIQRMDRKLARKKDPSDRVRGTYQKSKQLISVKPEFNQNMAQHAASTFTYMDKVPVGKDPIVFNYERWMQHVGREFDTKTKGSLREIEKAFNQIYGHRFKKQGGILNYITYFK